MFYTLGKAAKATGKSKPTISEAIKSGKISAQKQPNGSYIIDPAELHRVYPLVNPNRQEAEETEPFQTGKIDSDNRVLQSKVELLGELVRQISDERDDLRRRLDQSDEERRRLTLMITHQPAQPPVPAAQIEASPFYVKPVYWGALAAATAAAAAWWWWPVLKIRG